MSSSTRIRRPGLPGGFTLVELLVVVGIVAMLAAITLPAIFGARVAAKNAAIRAEIDMLHMAMMNYRNEYGSFPPCTSANAAAHIQRIFPRCSGSTQAAGLLAGGPFLLNAGSVTPDEALVAWLQGYTNDPQNPVTGTATGGLRRKLFDFDQSRTGTTAWYWVKDKPDSPFIYIDSGNYGSVVTPSAFTVGSVTIRPELQVLGTGTQFFNPDTFQILSPGLDQSWNTDDDISNFWPTTRGAYNASLR